MNAQLLSELKAWLNNEVDLLLSDGLVCKSSFYRDAYFQIIRILEKIQKLEEQANVN